MKALSIFVDESGDFGPVSFHAPYYLASLVFQEQADAFDEHAGKLDESFRQRGLESYLPVHSAPLIRREGAYRNVEGATSESAFFGGADTFKKTYYRVFARQRFMGTL